MDSNKIIHTEVGDYQVPDRLVKKSIFRKNGDIDMRRKRKNAEIIAWAKKLDQEMLSLL